MSLEQYKDATRKELWEILQIQVERIAELEKERDQILNSALDSESNYCELKDSLPAHNLEQQKEVIDILYRAGKCDADCLKYFETLRETK
jgi:hypothetical protein